MRLWGAQPGAAGALLPRCTCAVCTLLTHGCALRLQEDLKALVVSNKGFEWVDDASPVPGVPQSPKLGWAGNTPGSALTLQLNTTVR